MRVLSLLLFLSISSLSLRGVLSSPSYSSSYSVLRSLTPGEKCQGFDCSLKLNLSYQEKKCLCFLFFAQKRHKADNVVNKKECQGKGPFYSSFEK